MIKPKIINHHSHALISLNDCLAKTIKQNNITVKGVNVFTHCVLTGLVARELINRQPKWLQELLYPSGSELIAAAHDIGKVYPYFQEKIYHEIENKPLGIGFCLDAQNLDKQTGYHSTVSQATLAKIGKFIPEIVGRHHGFSPIAVGLPNDEKYGGIEWQKQRIVLLKNIIKFFNVNWPTVNSEIYADILSGLTSVSDWISSGSFEKIKDEDIDISNINLQQEINEALNNAGFLQPHIHKGLSFKDIFGFDTREIQAILINSVKNPGVYVLEAQMGEGKTEAALYAAYQALVENRATGIYFALPTQLTSNKIYDRFQKFLEKILEKDSANSKSLLLHGSSLLEQTQLGEDGSPGQSWFNVNKRGLLAPFAVGTIDQALMAAMNVKHGFVRTFGLAGKVVILDEVHSYDTYTGTILNQLVKILTDVHCTVIILSATLTGEKRIELLNDTSFVPSTAYPLVSSKCKNEKIQEYTVTKKIKRKNKENVLINILNDDSDAENEALKRAKNGEQVLWIENTVAEAQEKYFRFSNNNVECGLLHSRFLKIDRKNHEEKWVNLFGKKGIDKRQLNGRILIGTQVLEQSLDIDSDFLVTRICPIDMLLQRCGRLWRHRENDIRRPKTSKREMLILAPDLHDAIENKKILGNTAYVYSPYVLCRTLETLQNLTSILLPNQIRELLEATYIDKLDTGKMCDYKHEIEEKRKQLQNLALLAESRGGKTLSDNNATTRYSDRLSVDVLLIKSKYFDKAETHITFIDNSELLLNTHKKNSLEWRKAAVAIHQNTVCVSEYIAPDCSRQSIDWLKDYVYLGDLNDEKSLFRVALVDNSRLLTLNQNKLSENYNLSYDNDIGYRAIKKVKWQ